MTTSKLYKSARLYGRITEIKSNFRRKKLHKMNKGCNLFVTNFRHIDYLQAPFNLEEKDNLNILDDDFSSTTE